MKLPRFLLGDNTDFTDAIFIIHTEFPRFVINLVDDEIEWLEEFKHEDEQELTSEVSNLVKEASEFYDREMARYEEK